MTTLNYGAIFHAWQVTQVLCVFIDELGIISHGLNSAQARDANYDMLLKIMNECGTGNANAIGFFLAGTDDFLNDSRRGIASNEALNRRVRPSPYEKSGLKGNLEPVIYLENLSIEDIFVLLCNIRNVFASGDSEKFLIPDEGIEYFLADSSKTLRVRILSVNRSNRKELCVSALYTRTKSWFNVHGRSGSRKNPEREDTDNRIRRAFTD